MSMETKTNDWEKQLKGAIPTSDDYAKGWNDSRQENYKVKSLKVKEIISEIGK